METFELLLQLPRSYLKAENEIFYQLFKEEKLVLQRQVFAARSIFSIFMINFQNF